MREMARVVVVMTDSLRLKLIIYTIMALEFLCHCWVHAKEVLCFCLNIHEISISGFVFSGEQLG